MVKKNIAKKPTKRIITGPKKSLTWQDRLEFYAMLSNSLDVNIKNGDKLCVENNMLGKAIKMGVRFGSPSAFGEAFTGYTFEGNHLLAIKKIPLGRYDQKGSFTRKQLRSGDSVWAEIAAYLICTILVIAKICPNLPLMYKYVWCPKCVFENKKIRNGAKGLPCLLVANEMADGDLKMYLHERLEIWTHDLIDNMVFQLVAALYCLEKYFDMTHNDFHYGNVLVHEIEPGGFWEYKIDGVRYFIPNLGYMFLLWDFGMVHVPKIIKGRPEFGTLEASPLPSETDIGRICTITFEVLAEGGLKTLSKHPMLRHISKWEGKMTLKEIIDKFFHIFTKKPSSSQIIDAYNMDIPKKTLREAFPKEIDLIMSGKTASG